MRINHGTYTLQRIGDVTHVYSARYGRWDAPRTEGIIYSPVRPMPPGARTHGIEFNFSSFGYFCPDNVGHFAVVCRGGVTSPGGVAQLDGRGFTLGTVTGYPQRTLGDGPAHADNCATIETWWAPDGNALYGEATASPTLTDRKRYHVEFRCTDSADGARGRVLELDLSEVGIPLHSVRMYDYLGQSDGERYGLSILEVFSTHDWVMRIDNLIETIE